MAEETENQTETPVEETKSSERVSVDNLRVLENIDVTLTVEVGQTEIKIRDLLRLNEGSVINLTDSQVIPSIFWLTAPSLLVVR